MKVDDVGPEEMTQLTAPGAQPNSKGSDPNSQGPIQKRLSPAARKVQGVAEAEEPSMKTRSLSSLKFETDASNQLLAPATNQVAPALSKKSPRGHLTNGPATTPNILIFGETGAGKSSVLNMIAGDDVASVSGDAQGHTFRSTSYPVTIDDKTPVTFWDTAGLNEGEHGTVPATQAMRNLQDLVGNMHGGLSLLVFCIRGSRFREIWKINYDLFAGIICQGNVPVVLVVNGLEHESPMENWWLENGEELTKRGMTFNGHACITSTRGKQLKSGEYMYQEEFEESETVARRLIVDHCLGAPWVVDSGKWLSEITLKMARYYQTESSSDRQSAGRQFEPKQQRGVRGVGASLSDVVKFFHFLRGRVTKPTADSRQIDSGRHSDCQCHCGGCEHSSQ